MISIVIPLYNKAASIARTIASIQAQGKANWELIVVDDGSTDDGATIVQSIDDPRIRLLTQTNAGVSAARNRGATEARSDCVAFLDADDYWDADHLDNLLGLMQRFPDAVLWATAYKVVGESGQSRKVRLRHEGDGAYLMNNYFADVMDFGHPVCSSAVAVKKSTLIALGGFPLGVKSGEDIVMWARFACAGEMAYSGRATASYVAPPLAAREGQAVIRRPQTPDSVGAALAELRATSDRHAPSLRRFAAGWHRIRAMLFLELNERSASLAELRRAMLLSGPTLKDVACCGLLVLPLPWRRSVLASIRRNNGRG